MPVPAVEKFQSEERLTASRTAADERDPPLRHTAVQDPIQPFDLRGCFANSDRIFPSGFAGGGSVRSGHENPLVFSSRQGTVLHSSLECYCSEYQHNFDPPGDTPPEMAR
jgi:hypothetical protein